MRTRSLGAEGPEVSVVGLGTNNFGARIDYDESKAVIDEAIEQGITLVDTADIYSQGTSEEHIGRALEGRRDAVLVATKFGKQMNEDPSASRGSREYVRWAIEGSLRRLRTRLIDVYQMHEPDPSTPIEETLGVLDELVREGKVRYIGSSNFSSVEIEEADDVARARGLTRFVSAQNEYSLVKRAAEDGHPAGLRAARDRHAAVLPARERPTHGQVRARRDGDGGTARRARRSPRSSGSASRRCSTTPTSAGSRSSTSPWAGCWRCRRSRR